MGPPVNTSREPNHGFSDVCPGMPQPHVCLSRTLALILGHPDSIPGRCYPQPRPGLPAGFLAKRSKSIRWQWFS
jgi:hypothetical protein